MGTRIRAAASVPTAVERRSIPAAAEAVLQESDPDIGLGRFLFGCGRC